MSKHELGADRVLHEGAGYRDKYKFKSQKPPVGSREKPSDPKQEGTDAVYIPDTAKWMKKINHRLIDQNNKSGIM
jgi:hypothetical protein